jgi:hypothetical protein
MDQAIRNKLRGAVTECRKLLEDSVSQELQGKFGIYAANKDAVQVDDDARMTHLGSEERAARREILDHFEHIKARGFKQKDALDQLVREIAYTHLNRFCAYKMMEARQVYIGDQRFREAVSRGVNSNGVKFYLADHPDDERLYTTGKQDVAYRHFLDWLGGLLSEEIGVLFNPNDSANRLYPTQKVLDEILALLNDDALAEIWTQDETIGWVYQYFTPKELRDRARKDSAAPHNSYELAFLNQFFTPRYVVEFLTDNTLGRLWHEMCRGDTRLKDQCRYLVRRPTEVFLAEGQQAPREVAGDRDDLPERELLKQPAHIPHRPKKDPRELRILDPACGSGHFLLYCFDLLVTIYEEAYADPALGPKLKKDYLTLDDLRRDLPRLILAHNTHVKPTLGDGKIAYVWVDALRFEMARELCRLLKDDFDLTIQPAIGTIPTITEIGMAALLPKANESLKVVAIGGGKLALEIGGKIIKDRKDRIAFLKEYAGATVFDCKLDDLLPKPNKKVKDGIQSAELILVTSQEIDELCEADNIAQARLQMDGVLGHLRRCVRILSDHGIKTIILAADHGHLFADEIGEDMKIEAPGGTAEDLHRRVWIGVGGSSESTYLRTSLSSLGIESEFDIATPWTFACFKSKGGARAYFHGGLSPQEVIVPVVSLTSTAKVGGPTMGIEWTLTPGTTKLTTRFFSLQIAGTQLESNLFGFEPPKVRIEVRANKKCVSVPVSASYGFEDATGEVKLKIAEQDGMRIEPNTVTVMIAEDVSQKTVGVHLLDATTGAELAAPLTVEVAISM